MSELKMREELLAAFEARQKRMAQGMIGAGDGDRVRGYLERHVNLSDFEAGWQASRETLVIELPCSFRQDYMSSNQVMDEDRVIEAIEAAGVKVKP